jgi:hypothetical protein
MWKCAASAATSIESLNELVCVSCHIVIDFRNVSESLYRFIYMNVPLLHCLYQ